MKKIFAFFSILVFSTSLFAYRVGLDLAKDPIRLDKATGIGTGALVQAFLRAEIRKGGFILDKTQVDPFTGAEHRRYVQVFRGLRIWGGEIVGHVKDGQITSYNGTYYIIPDATVIPRLSPGEALESLQSFLGIQKLREDLSQTELLIFPLSDQEFRLGYKMVVENFDHRLLSETAIVDAADGRVLSHYSNIVFEDLTIGSGMGQRGDAMKFPTRKTASTYEMADPAKVRPFRLFTYDFKHTFSLSIPPALSSASNNSWPKDNVVNIHTYIGYCYDYFFTLFGLKGIDNSNEQISAFAHTYSTYYGLYDNALWYSGSSLWGPGFYFLDPYYSGMDFGAAIDVVAHEYSHGVTGHFSNLNYFYESGALNESFSDIMGTAVEFAFQSSGQAYNKADWISGEDANTPFSYQQCRSQSDPNSNSQLKNAGYPSYLWYPDPCNIKQKIPNIYYYGNLVDAGGVHLNCTIFPNAFYLLANGGTNKYSGLSVTGIGIEKAAKIFYHAWVFHMNSATQFIDAANLILSAALELYGSSSTEYAQAKNAIRAIGYTVL